MKIEVAGVTGVQELQNGSADILVDAGELLPFGSDSSQKFSSTPESSTFCNS
jgi:hypothetical protein